MHAHHPLQPSIEPSQNSTSKFTCGKCRTSCEWLGEQFWFVSSVPEQALWKRVFEAAHRNEDSCKVTCPSHGCGEEHLQCTHCNTSVLIHDNSLLIRETRTAQGAMNKHLRKCSSRRKNRDKRLETEASVLPQATVDFYSGQDNSKGC